MEDFPRDLPEFEARFSTEAACLEYLFRLRWPESFCCPRGGGRKGWPKFGVLTAAESNCQSGPGWCAAHLPDSVSYAIPGGTRNRRSLNLPQPTEAAQLLDRWPHGSSFRVARDPLRDPVRHHVGS